MMSPQVVVTNRVHPQVLEFLESRSTVVANPDREPLPRHELLRRAKDATALLAFMTDRVDEAFLAQCPKLHIIAGTLKGADNFDVDACTRRAVLLAIVPDLLTPPAAALPRARPDRSLRVADRATAEKGIGVCRKSAWCYIPSTNTERGDPRGKRSNGDRSQEV